MSKKEKTKTKFDYHWLQRNWTLGVAILCGIIVWVLFNLYQFGAIGIDKGNEIWLTIFVNVFMIMFSFLLSDYFRFSPYTRNQLKATHTKLDDLKKSIDNRIATADNFFVTRGEKDKKDTFESIVDSKPKKIKYSGGHLHNLITGMMTNGCFKDYIINNNVEVQFLFPDPTNKGVITNLVENITVGNKENTYKTDIYNAVTKLKTFIETNNLENRVMYKFKEDILSEKIDQNNTSIDNE